MDYQVLNDLCFLCLSHYDNLQSIFSKNGNELTIKDKLTHILLDHINFLPNIEKFICLNCLEIVNNIYEFRESCIKSIKTLTDYLKIQTSDNKMQQKLFRTLDIIDNKKKQAEIPKNNENNDKCKEIELKFIKNEITTLQIEDIEIEEDCQSSLNRIVSSPILLPNILENTLDLDQGNSSNESLEQIYVKQEIPDDYENNFVVVQNNERESERTHNISGQISATSRKRYDLTYSRFMDWKREKQVDNFSEEVILNYFQEVGTVFKAPTLWGTYSMLRSTLLEKHQVDITAYLKLRAFLRKRARGYKAKKSQSLTNEEILKFINEAPDYIYLLIKVVLIIGITGACARDELCYLRTDQLEDFGNSFIIKIQNSRTKTMRQFSISGHFYKLVKKYIALRPPDCAERRLFLNYKKGRCIKQVIGINKVGKLPKEIASYLNLPNPELYTGNCFRRTSNTLKNK